MSNGPIVPSTPVAAEPEKKAPFKAPPVPAVDPMTELKDGFFFSAFFERSLVKKDIFVFYQPNAETGGVLYWFEVKGDAGHVIPINEIREVNRGKKGDAFYSPAARHSVVDRCFSLVGDLPELCLDLEAESDPICALWIKTISDLVKATPQAPKREVLPKVEEEKPQPFIPTGPASRTKFHKVEGPKAPAKRSAPPVPGKEADAKAAAEKAAQEEKEKKDKEEAAKAAAATAKPQPPRSVPAPRKVGAPGPVKAPAKLAVWELGVDDGPAAQNSEFQDPMSAPSPSPLSSAALEEPKINVPMPLSASLPTEAPKPQLPVVDKDKRGSAIVGALNPKPPKPPGPAPAKNVLKPTGSGASDSPASPRSAASTPTAAEAKKPATPTAASPSPSSSTASSNSKPPSTPSSQGSGSGAASPNASTAPAKGPLGPRPPSKPPPAKLDSATAGRTPVGPDGKPLATKQDTSSNVAAASSSANAKKPTVAPAKATDHPEPEG